MAIWRPITLAVLLPVLAALVVACASPKPTAVPTVIPTPALDASGQPIVKPVGAAAKTSEFSGWKVSIAKVGRATTIVPPGLVPLQSSGVWLIIHLTAANDGKTATAFPRQSLSVKGATGKEYKLDAGASDHYSIGAKLRNQAETIQPRGSIEVGVVFDVDPAATGLKLKVGTQELAIEG